MTSFRPLSRKEIEVLNAQGCSANDWSAVSVAEGFDTARMHNTHLFGRVRIGALTGMTAVGEGIELPSEIRDATLIDCEIGDNVCIRHVGHIANYKIQEGAVIEGVGSMVARPGATFGAGAVLTPVNEAGGREIRIFAGLSSTFAYIHCMHRGRKKLTEAMERIIDAEIRRSDMGEIGARARICGVNEIVDVAIGPHAGVIGVSSLRNGTILSEPRAQTFLRGSVCASDFIIGEGSRVESGAVLDRVFVGQAVQIGRNFSAQDSLFFANCEAFHGEACAIFAGPFTVTHHKNTLLIAAIYSFFNAGSGTNHSNHMYKLGPVHEGVFARGSKTGSNAYLLFPSVVGPFSMVLGRHGGSFDAGEFPFSYIVAEEGRSMLMPAMNLFKIGTVRDGEKWPRRDRRTASVPRDRIVYETLSPYTIGLMIRAEKVLFDLYDRLSPHDETAHYRGLTIKRALLYAGAKTYSAAIDAWLARKVFEFVVPPSGGIILPKGFVPPEGATANLNNWSDIGGLLISRERLETIENKIESGEIDSLNAFDDAMTEAAAAYDADSHAWARAAFEMRSGKAIRSLSSDDRAQLEKQVEAWDAIAEQKILADAAKEFSEAAHYGYGLDADDPAADFDAVRGAFESNPYIQELHGKSQKGKEAA